MRMTATASLAADAPSSSLPRPLPVTMAMRAGSASTPSAPTFCLPHQDTPIGCHNMLRSAHTAPLSMRSTCPKGTSCFPNSPVLKS